MNLNLSSVVMLLASLVLGIAAIKNRDPRDIIRDALLNKPPAYPPLSAPTSPITPMEPSEGIPPADPIVWTSV